jgi:hypothetical protein
MKPPDNLPIYRVLTGVDDATFCHRVSDALALGYVLYGSPAATFNGKQVIVAQALVWPTAKKSIAIADKAIGKQALRKARGVR